MEPPVTASLEHSFRGKRILLTGHTGFKGSWLAHWLAHLGADVTGYALAPEYARSHFELLDLENRITHVEADIRDAAAIRRVVEETRPDIVFHLAAQALVRRSYDQPKVTFDTNVSGAVNLLEALRPCDSLRALVFVTSDKAYLNKEWTWGYRESDELGGHDPYSASKAAAEMVFMAYRHSFFQSRPDVGVASARAGNVIGGGDWATDRVIPDCMRALRDGEPIELRNPQATRPWQHVLDPLHGYLVLAAALLDSPPAFSSAWNFGPEIERGMTVREIADRAVECWGSGRVIEDRDREAVFEHVLLQLCIDKAKLELGWLPLWSSAEAVERTVEWYLRVNDGEPAQDVTQSQILEFMES